MNGTLSEESRPVLLQIQNSKKPDQMIRLVMDRSNGHFETEGLKDLFGVKEIRIETGDVLGSLVEYAGVLSFLLEAMSAAQDLNLPFAYENEFELQGVKYTLYNKGDYRVLQRVDA
jgi:hypothetical protein